MNQPLFKQTSYTPPAVYQPAGVSFHPNIPQTFTPMYKNQQIVVPRPETIQNKPSNYINFRGQQAQSYIFPSQNAQGDQNRTLKLQSFARKVSFQEQNNGAIESSSFPNARLNHSIQRTLDARQPVTPFTANLNQNNKRPLFASEMLTNQDFRIDLNSKKNEQNQLKSPQWFPQNQGNRSNGMKAELRLSLNAREPEMVKKQSKTDRQNAINKTGGYMNYIGSNLKYRQFPTHNHQNTTSSFPSSQSLQSSSSKNNVATLDSTHSTQNSSHNHSLSHKDEVKEKDVPNTTPFQNNSSPVNFWPLSISPYEQKKQSFPAPKNSSVANDKKVEVKQKNQQCVEFKKKKPLQFLNKSKQKAVEYPIKSFTINDFQLLDKIGKGSFGDVYMAQQKLTGFLVVLKKLQKKKIAEMKTQEHLLRQIKIQAFLKHRHLTSLYGFFSDETYVYLILEIMPDGSIMQVKKKRKISQSETASYIRQICQGLKYMHTEEIIHRDIKPENIFLNSGYAKIGDFGCSIYTQSLRNTVIGSLAYISPEQLKQGSYDEKIDVWSLGVMAYQMMVGSSPFQQDIIKIAKNQIAPQLSELKFPSQIQLSPEAKDFLTKMLHLDPNLRIGIGQAVRHDFIRKYAGKDEGTSQVEH